MTFSLIVPSSVETAATGFVMGAKKTIYKQEWQISIIQTTETKNQSDEERASYYNGRRKQSKGLY